MNMQLLSWFSVLVFALIVSAKSSAEVTELQIETSYKPDDCKVVASKGDKVKVHYVRVPNISFLTNDELKCYLV